MAELLNFPFINQRVDGDSNAEFDCVPSSLAAGANYLLGSSVINDAAMKDAIYGSGYVGGTAASAYVDYLSARGIHLYAIDGAYAVLIQQAHSHLAQGHPVVFTRDDPYAPTHPDWSHVCVWYADTSNSLVAMDPYGGYSVSMSDAEWMSHLRFNEFWIMEKKTMVPQGWHDDGSTLTAPNGHKVRLGFRDYMLNYPGGWDPENQPQCEEYHQDPVEYSNPSLGPGQKLPCTKDTLEYTDARGVFKAWQGQEIYVLTQLLAKAQQPAPPQPALNLSDAVALLKTIPTDAASKVAQILKDLGVQ